jgi:AcrR family transcriptional regulator
MPPKTKFTKKDIIDAALEIAKEKGLSHIHARSVASQLNSSVAPIYVNFATIDDLVEAVVSQIFRISEELFAEQNGQSIFEKMGKASLAFAREYPTLFRDLVIQPNPYMDTYDTVENSLVEDLMADDALQGWTFEEIKKFMLKMRAFQIGLSVMLANDQVPSWLDDQEFDALLMEVGGDVLLSRQIKREGNKKGNG